MPDTEVPFVQTDGVSCGFHCLVRMEEAFCEFRGQRLYRCYKSVSEIRKSLNAFVQTLLAFKRQQAKKGAPPPLPPPPTPPLPLLAAPRPILAARQTNRQTNRQTFGVPYCLLRSVTGRWQRVGGGRTGAMRTVRDSDQLSSNARRRVCLQQAQEQRTRQCVATVCRECHCAVAPLAKRRRQYCGSR